MSSRSSSHKRGKFWEYVEICLRLSGLLTITGALAIGTFVGTWLVIRCWGQFSVGGKESPLGINQFFWWCWSENGFAAPIDIKPLNLIATLSIGPVRICIWALLLFLGWQSRSAIAKSREPLRQFKLRPYVLSLEPPGKPTSQDDQALLNEQKSLRGRTYKHWVGPVPNEFLDDSDMTGPYKLIIIRDQTISHGPTIVGAARVYSTKDDIEKELDGAVTRTHYDVKTKKMIKPVRYELPFGQDELDSGVVSLIDRLVIRINVGDIVLHHAILLNLYRQIALECKEAKGFIALARQCQHEDLLQRYLALGFEIGGEREKSVATDGHPYKHWVLIAHRKDLPEHVERSLQLQDVLRSVVKASKGTTE